MKETLTKFGDKTVMVTGSCGTVGTELVRQLVQSPAKQIVCIDNNESELFFQIEQYKNTNKVLGYLADVRDRESLQLRMRGVDVVLHAAALKHVGLCEASPNQAIQTNITGTQNIIDAALRNGVQRVLFTSSDKAVNPTNVMGTSKLMGERLITAAAEIYSNSGIIDSKNTVFASTRFGNVLGSRGSVVPLFKRQIESGGPITLTDPAMTRFVMTLSQAVALVLESVWIAKGGEVLVPKMPVARISDLAVVMRNHIKSSKEVKITTIGSKPGEKLYEELMNEEEVRRAYEHENFIIILSAFADISNPKYQYLANSPRVTRPYNSSIEPALEQATLFQYVLESGAI